MGCPTPRGPRSKTAEIFQRFGPGYAARHPLPAWHRRVLGHLCACRTAALGGHLYRCDHCGHRQPHYNSCRDRHCPSCQSLDQHRWLEGRMQRLVEAPFFHVVFTLPAQLRPLARANPSVVYDLLFRAATRTLLQLGAQRLGATLGVTAVLHTWSRQLNLHPHLHCVVTGGGLSLDGERWVESPKRFLFPVAVMRALFRGKLLASLEDARRRGKLRFVGAAAPLANEAIFQDLLRQLRAIDWVVYAKRPFGGPAQVLRYLGRYTHRVAISSARIHAVRDDAVVFRTRGERSCTLQPDEFIRRFLLHVLPKGFRKIRHFGLFAPANVGTRLRKAQQLRATGAPEEAQEEEAAGAEESTEELFERLTGNRSFACPSCDAGTLMFFAHLEPDGWDSS